MKKNIISQCLRQEKGKKKQSTEMSFFEALQAFCDSPEFQKIGNEKDIPYSSFIVFLNINSLKITGLNTEEESFCQEWLGKVSETFMHTSIEDIPLERLLYLDGHFEDAEELLPGMETYFKEGKHIFRNPNSKKNEIYSRIAQQCLIRHPYFKNFIESVRKEQERLAKIDLPESFYDALFEYLNALDKIGMKHTLGWNFSGNYLTSNELEGPQTKTEASERQSDAFDQELEKILNEDQKKGLARKKIIVPLRSVYIGLPSQQTYENVRTKMFCVVMQQIYLWTMLKTKRPELTIPLGLRVHRDGLLFNLGVIHQEEWGLAALHIFVHSLGLISRFVFSAQLIWGFGRRKDLHPEEYLQRILMPMLPFLIKELLDGVEFIFLFLNRPQHNQLNQDQDAQGDYDLAIREENLDIANNPNGFFPQLRPTAKILGKRILFDALQLLAAYLFVEFVNLWIKHMNDDPAPDCGPAPGMS